MKVSYNITTFCVNGKKIFKFEDCILYCSIQCVSKAGNMDQIIKIYSFKNKKIKMKNFRNFYLHLLCLLLFKYKMVCVILYGIESCGSTWKIKSRKLGSSTNGNDCIDLPWRKWKYPNLNSRRHWKRILKGVHTYFLLLYYSEKIQYLPTKLVPCTSVPAFNTASYGATCCQFFSNN